MANILIILIVGVIFVMAFYFLEKRPNAIDHLEVIRTKDKVLKQYDIKLGNFNGHSAIIYIGENALYFSDKVTGVLDEMHYHEILSVEVGSPTSMYMMNNNIEGLLANAMTDAQVGKCVFIEVDLSYRTMTCTIAGISQRIALQIEDDILKQKYISDTSF